MSTARLKGNFQSPCVIFPAVKGWSVKVEHCWSHSCRESCDVKAEAKPGVETEEGGPSGEPWGTPVETVQSLSLNCGRF